MKRVSDYPINKLILNRWSQRAMSGKMIKKEELYSLFEAARWAPSSYNNQPWRFIYSFKNTPEWHIFFNLLVEFNQEWCKNASILIVIISKKTFDFNNKASRTHSFDSGAALQNLALQGFDMGLVVHAMEGFDYDKTKTSLEITDDYMVEAMCAIGKPGKKEDLAKKLQDREKPSERKPITDFIFEGKFTKKIK